MTDLADRPAAPPDAADGPLAPLLGRVAARLDGPVEPGGLRVAAALRPALIGVLAGQAAPLLVVTADGEQAERTAEAVGALLGERHVEVVPAWETLPLERLSPQPATVGRRLRALERLSGPADERPLVVVTPVRAALQPLQPAVAQRRSLRVAEGDEIDVDRLVDRLVGLGYVRTRLVTARGEVAVRGGVIDVFPSAAEQPVRIELLGDEVERLRTFSAADQRAVERVEQVVVEPARELVLDDELRRTARRAADALPDLAEPLGRLADGLEVEGMEALAALLEPRPALLPELLPDGSGLVLADPDRIAERAVRLHREADELAEVVWASAGGPPTVEGGGRRAGPGGFAELAALRAAHRGPTWLLDPHPHEGRFDLPGTAVDSLRGDLAAAARRVRDAQADGQAVVVTASTRGTARRLATVLADEGVAAPLRDRVPDEAGRPPADGRPGPAVVVPSALAEGFASAELGLLVLGEWDLLGPRRSRGGRRAGARRTGTSDVLELEEGRPVVHRVHGIGRYRGVVTRRTGGPLGVGGRRVGEAVREYVEVEYAGDDRLYVPTDQLDSLSRYVGGEDPPIMRMGGGDWQRARRRAREDVERVAAELLGLYEARKQAPGRAFEPDPAWMRELEQSFPHEETDDQLRAVREVLADLAAERPMDRLVCGDVGFGKTEVAVRAAGAVVLSGAQVAVLVPTTLLAEQHGETFTERFAGFPVRVEVLSRFSSPGEQRRILDGLREGTVDVVVGTHRLLSDDVALRDLGLVVVDEEQRFGVRHKERLKQLRTSVDVLTMTATPIPRTLEMAVSGIRDLSVIETAPEDRQPVVTHVGPLDEDLAALAVRRELLRDGQVFWVHNEVRTIDAAAERVRELVPGARVGVAHGQQDEDALERTMLAFWRREVDVLVCTTIIESGLDVPNANTLVIERADLLGLGQLHQLRGRVGRSAARGYAYLFHPAGVRIDDLADPLMTEQARSRLETAASHAGLGAGMSIALRDLEIRGAGSLLGRDQSGRVATVGFDEYARLVTEAVAELGGEEVDEPEPEVRVELPVDAHLPPEWIPDEGLRLEAYRRIAAVRTAAGIEDVRAELTDRYGPLPDAADRLLRVAALRAVARRFGITDVVVTPRRTARITPVSLSDAQQARLRRIHRGATYQAASQALELPLVGEGDGDGGSQLLAWLARSLAEALAPPRRR